MESTAHRRIANHYLSSWGGLLNGLPDLLNPKSRDRDARYGLSHVAEHLAAGGNWTDLKQLVTSFVSAEGAPARQPWATAWFAAEGHFGSYLRDLGRLWDRADADRDVGTALSAALIASSIRSQSAQLSPGLLVGLVQVGTTEGRWSLSAALGHARFYQSSSAQADMVLRLLESMSEVSYSQIIEFIGTIDGELDRARVTEAVANKVSNADVAALLAAIRRNLVKSVREKSLATLIDRASKLAHESRSALLEEVRLLDPAIRARLLARLAGNSDEPGRSVLFRETLAVIQGIPGSEPQYCPRRAGGLATRGTSRRRRRPGPYRCGF